MSSLPFRAIGIFSRPRRADITDIVRPLLEWLSKRGIRAVYDTETAASLRDESGGRPRELLAHESDLLLVLVFLQHPAGLARDPVSAAGFRTEIRE